MIILPNQKLGFIAISRCASASVETVLAGYQGVSTDGSANLRHLRYRDVEKFILPLIAARSVERPHFFAVVRHPAARILSFYTYRSREALKLSTDPVKASRYTGDISLEEFVDHAINDPEKSSQWHVETQMNFVIGAAGKVAVDTLIKIESLDQMLFRFLARFKIKPKVEMQRLNASSKPQPAGMPDALLRKILNSDRFGPDMDLYNQGITALPNTLPRQKPKAAAD